MNTASAIRSAVAGRSERLQHRLYSATGLGEVFNDSNVHLSVKSSPEKTVLALSPLAEKEGTVVKLNDSGTPRLIHSFSRDGVGLLSLLMSHVHSLLRQFSCVG